MYLMTRLPVSSPAKRAKRGRPMRPVELTPEQHQELVRARETHAKAYVRERAAALLKIAAGTSAPQVARSGLLRPRVPGTVYSWLQRYREGGLPGLLVRKGRGRKPAFSPVHAAAPAAKEGLLRLVRRDPRTLGVDRTRWRLADLLDQCAEWNVTTVGGLSGLLSRLGISYQRGRDYVHSPDPDYQGKIAAIAALREQSQTSAGREVVLYLDELTYYRQPSLASTWEARGAVQPRACRSYRANTPTRVIATLDPADGRVVAWQGSKIGIDQQVRFYQQVREAYPQAERLHVILDNWPVHFHPDVLLALEPQESPWPRYVPGHWSTEPSARARKRWGELGLPIQLVPLPTYASWENPIEKLWRCGKQELIHLHGLADRLEDLRRAFLAFLARFAGGSQALLRYVGLLKPA